MYVTSRGAPRTGLPFVLPVSFDKIDNIIIIIILYNQVLNKIKIAVRISSRKGRI